MSTKKLQIIGGKVLQSDWEEMDSESMFFIKNKPELSTSALSGSYNDLTDLPVIDSEIKEGSDNAITSGAVFDELAKKANVADLAQVSTSGSYKDLKDIPGIGNEAEAGFTKLYTTLGENEDGAMTQKATIKAIQARVPKTKMVVVPFESWEGEGPYTQTLIIDEIAVNSKIDVQADANTISELVKGEFSVTIKNDNGVAIAYAVGKKPQFDMSLQIVITEVKRENDSDVVWGNPLVGTGMAGSFVASNEAPANLHYLWIDRANGNLLKYYDGAEWVPISAAWG